MFVETFVPPFNFGKFTGDYEDIQEVFWELFLEKCGKCRFFP